MTPRAVVLLSGGLDSSTVLAYAKREGFACYALSFRYGQRHVAELAAAAKVARAVGVIEHRILEFDLGSFGNSALTSDALEVPLGRPLETMGESIPVTYVPARNTIFLSFALAWAEVLGSSRIFLGANALDYSGYPDCRPAYFEAFERMANLATKAGVEGTQRLKIEAPLLWRSKAQVVQLGRALGLDFGLTRSCYLLTPEGLSCGRCDACQLRQKGFADSGLKDPAPYVRGA